MRTCEKCGAALRNLDGYNAGLPVTQCGDCFRRTIAPVPTSRGWSAHKHVQLSPEVREKLRVEREALRIIMNAKDGEDHEL